jgi:hypothetical protein
MKVILKQTNTTCDHCGELGNTIILYAEFAGDMKDAIQLCNEHAKYFAHEILKLTT